MEGWRTYGTWRSPPIPKPPESSSIRHITAGMDRVRKQTRVTPTRACRPSLEAGRSKEAWSTASQGRREGRARPIAADRGSEHRREQVRSGTWETKSASDVNEDVRELLRTCGDTLSRRFGSAERAFRFFDFDHDGLISAHELVSGLKNLGLSLGAREVRALVALVQNEDDAVSLEFFERMLGLQSIRPEEMEAGKQVHDALYLARLTLRDVFTAADADKDGLASAEEMHGALKKFLSKIASSRDQDKCSGAPAKLQWLLTQKYSDRRQLTYEHATRALALPQRPMDWEQDVIQKAQLYMLKNGQSARKCYQSLVDVRSRELSRADLAKWLGGLEPTLRLSEIDHLCVMFQRSASDKTISEEAFVARFTDAEAHEKERCMRWLRSCLRSNKMTLDDFLADADLDRDGNINETELLVAVQRLDPSVAAREIVQGLCAGRTSGIRGSKHQAGVVDVGLLRKHLQVSTAREHDWEHSMLERLRTAISASGHSPDTWFKQWDVDGNGILSEDELLEGVEKLGLHLDAYETSRLLQLADADASGTLDLKEFVNRFGAKSAAGKCGDSGLKQAAAAVASAGYRKDLRAPRELFERFAGWSDVMSRKEHRGMCKALEVQEDVEALLWRCLDPRGTGSTDMQAFLKCHELWERKAGKGPGRSVDVSAAAAGGNAAKAARYLSDTAYQKKLTLHELFEEVDGDQDGLVTPEDLHLFSIHTVRGGSRSRSAVRADISSDIQLPDFAALIAAEGSVVAVEELVLCISRALPARVKEGNWEKEAVHLLQEYFFKAIRERKLHQTTPHGQLPALRIDKRLVRSCLKDSGYLEADIDRVLHLLEGSGVAGSSLLSSSARQPHATHNPVTITGQELSNISIEKSSSLHAAPGGIELVTLPPPRPLDWISVSRCLHTIGCTLSKTFSSAQDVMRSVGRGSEAAASFGKIVEVLKDGNTTLGSLTPGQVSQVCREAGGNDGGDIGLEALAKLMDDHDWRRDLASQLADAAFDQRCDAGDLYRYQGLGFRV